MKKQVPKKVCLQLGLVLFWKPSFNTFLSKILLTIASVRLVDPTTKFYILHTNTTLLKVKWAY